MRSQTRLFLIFSLAALAISACTIRIATDVGADGAGTTTTEIGFSEEELTMMAEFDETPESFCQESAADETFPPEATYRVERREDGAWCIFTVPFNNLDELRNFYASGEGIQVNRLEITDGTFYYDVSVDMRTEDTAELGEIGVDIEFSWALTMPGNPQDHNADRVAGNTLTWDLAPGQVRTLQAQSPVGGGFPLGGGLPSFGVAEIVIILLCCLCLPVLLAGGIGGFFFWRSRQNRADETALDPVD